MLEEKIHMRHWKKRFTGDVGRKDSLFWEEKVHWSSMKKWHFRVSATCGSMEQIMKKKEFD